MKHAFNYDVRHSIVCTSGRPPCPASSPSPSLEWSLWSSPHSCSCSCSRSSSSSSSSPAPVPGDGAVRVMRRIRDIIMSGVKIAPPSVVIRSWFADTASLLTSIQSLFRTAPASQILTVSSIPLTARAVVLGWATMQFTTSSSDLPVQTSRPVHLQE